MVRSSQPRKDNHDAPHHKDDSFPHAIRRQIMTSQPGAIDEDDGAVPVACRLTSAGLAAQNGRWERLAARAMTERSETADGLRVSFRREPGVDDELRRLAEAENQCCPWADWAVRTHTGHIVLEVRSAADGIGALYRMFTGLPYLRAYRDRHQWITGPQAAPPARDRDPGPTAGVS
jgi:hypothetical protein